MEARKARKDYREARLSVEQVFELIEQLQERLKRLEAENHRLRQRLAQYEPEILREPTAGSPASPAQYGLAAEERRREKRARKRLRNHRRRGRRLTQVKFMQRNERGSVPA
jgi:cell division septum initiation protein DivIVA